MDPASPLKREVAWKKLAGEVFRKPEYPLVLAVAVGIGVQLFLLFCSVTLTTMAGFYSPINKGLMVSLTRCMLPLYGFCNGYTSARIYKFFNGTDWMSVGFVSGTLFPTIVAGHLFVIDYLEWIESGYATTLPVSDALLLCLVILLVNVPLSFFGSFIGLASKKVEGPVKVNRVAR